ncbi:MAG: hypothetical protein H6742_16690 [Alphaproteobacteria bacterium]|nr:hypothetical protein [Alphaproteobacteria bacterium]
MSASARVHRQRYYLGEALVVEHSPAPLPGPVRDRALLVLPPLGYEDTCAYRPLRTLADRLAAGGHVVLRLDWPGLGDSGRDADDPALWDAMRQAARDAIASLRARGLPRVAVLGVRAGGLLAAGLDEADDLALWGVPASGKAYLRELKAFHRMAAKAFGQAPADAVAIDGVEAGGFLHGPGLVAALQQQELVALAAARSGGRVLLVPRDGMDADEALVAAFGGVELRVAEGTGLVDLLEDPYFSKLSGPVAAAVEAWLGEDAGTVSAQAPAGASQLVLDGVVEEPWVVPGARGELVGIWCRPDGPVAPGAGVTVFYNAGGVRRSGPNRLWTRAARALARAGRPSLRVDVRDVGDADGTADPHPDLEAMYSPAAIDDALVAHAWAAERGDGAVDVVGLCSGAFMSVQVADRATVRRATMFNCLAWVWDDDARATGMSSQVGRSLLDARRWKRLLTGRIDARALARSLVMRARLDARAAVDRARGRPAPSPVHALVRRVQARGTTLTLVSSQADPSIDVLARHVPDGERPPLTVIPGVDHTIRPLWAHERVVHLVLAGPPPS